MMGDIVGAVGFLMVLLIGGLVSTILYSALPDQGHLNLILSIVCAMVTLVLAWKVWSFGSTMTGEEWLRSQQDSPEFKEDQEPSE